MKLLASALLLIVCLSFLTSSAVAFDVLASLFRDRNCSEVFSAPMGLDQGVCAYSGDFNSYYNISTTSSGQARFNFGCKPGCVDCAEVGTAPYGSCLSFQLGDTEVFATAWRVDTSAVLSATIFADPQCARQLPYGTITLQSGSCTYHKMFNSVGAAQLDARDSPKTEQIAFGLFCSEQCGDCSVYDRTAADLCTPIFNNVYMKIKTAHF